MNDYLRQLELAEKFIQDNLKELCQELQRRDQSHGPFTKLIALVDICDFVTENRYIFAERLVQSAAINHIAKET